MRKMGLVFLEYVAEAEIFAFEKFVKAGFQAGITPACLLRLLGPKTRKARFYFAMKSWFSEPGQI